jgi:hypothetical protein
MAGLRARPARSRRRYTASILVQCAPRKFAILNCDRCAAHARFAERSLDANPYLPERDAHQSQQRREAPLADTFVFQLSHQHRGQHCDLEGVELCWRRPNLPGGNLTSRQVWYGHRKCGDKESDSSDTGTKTKESFHGHNLPVKPHSSSPFCAGETRPCRLPPSFSMACRILIRVGTEGRVYNWAAFRIQNGDRTCSLLHC